MVEHGEAHAGGLPRDARADPLRVYLAERFMCPAVTGLAPAGVASLASRTVTDQMRVRCSIPHAKPRTVTVTRRMTILFLLATNRCRIDAV
jgi:hypothetical protein